VKNCITQYMGAASAYAAALVAIVRDAAEFEPRHLFVQNNWRARARGHRFLPAKATIG
jgi:hypothetical protein